MRPTSRRPRRYGMILVAALAATMLPVSASAAPSENDNWHVHDGGASGSGLKQFGVGPFPAIFAQEGLTYDAANDPMACPDATDKGGMLTNGSPANRPFVSGICMNDAYVIQLRSSIGGGGSAPAGWGSVQLSSFTLFYRLTARG